MKPLRYFLACTLVLTACSGNGDEYRGTVVEVVGDLTSVESFTVRLDDGTDRVFEPDPGILFHDSAPLSHLQEHRLNGQPVRVRYRTLNDGTLIAIEVGDA